MSIVFAFLAVMILLLLLLNTKRWTGLARGARDARRDLEKEIRSDDE